MHLRPNGGVVPQIEMLTYYVYAPLSIRVTPGKSSSGNYPTLYCLLYTTSTFPVANSVYCLSRRQ
jgi:hypothetical protein